MSAAGSARHRSIGPHELRRVLQSGKAAQLVDVRTPEEFAGGHVGAARNHPLDKLAAEHLAADPTWAKNAPVFVLCRSGRRAVPAAAVFAAAGFVDVAIVEGGTEAWIAAGFPVECG